MSSSVSSPGVAKALGYLANQAERSRLEGLTNEDLIVLRDSFSSGVSVSDFVSARDMARGKDPISLLGAEGKRAMVRPSTKKVFLVAYLSSEDVRKAYPVTTEELGRIRTLFDEDRHEAAVAALQTAINSGLEKSGKTRTVEVKLGTLKTRDVTHSVLRSLIDALPVQMQSLNISTTEMDDGGYEAYVQKHTVSGANKKSVGAAARILTSYLSEGKKLDDLQRVPGITVAKD